MADDVARTDSRVVLPAPRQVERAVTDNEEPVCDPVLSEQRPAGRDHDDVAELAYPPDLGATAVGEHGMTSELRVVGVPVLGTQPNGRTAVMFAGDQSRSAFQAYVATA